MKGNMDRRDFFKSSIAKTSAGLLALNEFFGSGIIAKGVRFASAAEQKRRGSICEILPLSIEKREVFADWTITYTAGPQGLSGDWDLVIRCASAINPPEIMSVTSTYPGFSPIITIEENISVPRVIWIDLNGRDLPPNEKIIITLDEYRVPYSTASCAYSVLEVDPDGLEPEIGSNLTFYEVPTLGGEVTASPTTGFNVVLPTVTKLGKPIDIKIAAMDHGLYHAPDFTGTVTVESDGVFQDLPTSIEFTAQDEGLKTIVATPIKPGIIRVSISSGAYSSESNPCVCSGSTVSNKIFWGDYHKHSVHCDGFLTAEENYDYAHKVAMLDFAMLSSHDMNPFPTRGAQRWSTLLAATEAAHIPRKFITFQGYEWSHGNPFEPENATGHKVIIFLRPEHMLPLIAYSPGGFHPEFMHPTTLVNKLLERAGDDVIMIPHHLFIFKWWVFPKVDSDRIDGPLPALQRKEIDKIQPVVEVFAKNNGNYESYDMQNWLKKPNPFGNEILHTFWQDGLKEGVRAGAMFGSDNHNQPMGHPDHTSMTAVVAPELTRKHIFRAIQNRNTYGTSGPRVFIDFRIDGAIMGDIRKVKPNLPPPVLEMNVASPVPIEYIEIVKVTAGSAEVPHIKQVAGHTEISYKWTDTNHDPAHWVCYYLRIHLDSNEHGAWTSPIWLEPYLQECDEDPIPVEQRFYPGL